MTDKVGTYDFKVSTAIISRGIEFYGGSTLNIFNNFVPHVPTVTANGNNVVNINSGYTQIGSIVYWDWNLTVVPTGNVTTVTFGNLPKVPIGNFISTGKFGPAGTPNNALAFNISPTSVIANTVLDTSKFTGSQANTISGVLIYLTNDQN